MELIMIKKILFATLGLLTAITAVAGEYSLSPEKFSSFYAQNATFQNGIFEGIPDNGGAALVAKIPADFPKENNFRSLIVEITNCDARQLSVSFRGKTQMQIKAVPGNKPDEYFFNFEKLPAELKQIRIYYNLKNAAAGKKINFTLKKALFSEPVAADNSNFTLLPSAFNSFYAQNVKFAHGIFEGVPENSGAALIANTPNFPQNAKFNRIILKINGVKAQQLALSLRGDKQQLQLKPVPGSMPDEFYFDIPELPGNIKQIRIYYNLKNAAAGKPVKFTWKSLKFRQEQEKKKFIEQKTGAMIDALPMPDRKRIVDRTRIFPRIQSKYDLIKNYLGGYSLGTGIFFDRPLFFDRTLCENPQPPYNKLNTPKSFRRQLKSAREFADGFAIFIGARKNRFTMPLEYVNNTGMTDAILVECPPPRFKNFELTCEQIDQALATPETFKIDGSLIISSYHGHVYSPEEWKELLAPYRKRYGSKVKFMCEMRLVCYALNKEYNLNGGKVSETFLENSRNTIRNYLEVMDGINFSGSNHLTVTKAGFPAYAFNADAYEKIIVPLVAGVLAEEKYNGKKLLGLSAHKVYAMNISHKSNVDEEGTAGLRRSLITALAANPDYILMPEWNEINENTHIEPTVSDARTNQRVIRAVLGKETAAEDHSVPHFILSFRQENDLAAPIPIELLGLPDKKATPYTVKLKLFAPDGKTMLKEFPEYSFNHRDIQAEFIMEPAQNYAQYRFIIPELTVTQGKSTCTIRRGLPVIRLTPAPNLYHRYVKIPLRDLPETKKITTSFALENGIISVKGHAETDSPMVTVELLADDIPIAAVDPHNEFAAPPGMILLRWRRSTPLTSGFELDSVKITATKGKIQRRLPAQYGLAAMEAPEQDGNTLYGKIGTGSSIREFLFFATPDAELEITERNETAAVKVKDVGKNGIFRKSNSCGVSWTLALPEAMPELPLPLDVKTLDFALSAPVSARHNPVYILRIITRDGEVFRSEPFFPEKKAVGNIQNLSLWDIYDKSTKNVQIPEYLLREVNYIFTPEYGDLLPANTGGSDFAGVMGGFDYRVMFANGFEAVKSPKWRQENNRWLLDFTPGCGLLIPPPVFSGSAFTIDMEFSINTNGEHTLFDTIGHTMDVKINNGKLYGTLITGNGKFPWEGASAKVVPGKFYHLQLHYDLKKFTVMLDGKLLADFPASGIIGNSFIAGVGGTPLKKKAVVSNVLHTSENASDIPDAGFNFNGSLRALSISNR